MDRAKKRQFKREFVKKEYPVELLVVIAGLEEYSNGALGAEFLKNAYSNEPDYLKDRCLRTMKEELKKLKTGDLELIADEK